MHKTITWTIIGSKYIIIRKRVGIARINNIYRWFAVSAKLVEKCCFRFFRFNRQSKKSELDIKKRNLVWIKRKLAGQRIYTN